MTDIFMKIWKKRESPRDNNSGVMLPCTRGIAEVRKREGRILPYRLLKNGSPGVLNSTQAGERVDLSL